MTPDLHSAVIKANYPFLAHPPPQKKRPLQPLPSPPSPQFVSAEATRGPRRRSGTFSAITAWAAHVQPGSPASLSPCSSYRRPSVGRSRRQSIVSIRAASASFSHLAPTPSTARFTDFKADLTTVGYTSVFLQIPNTPISASLSHSIKPSSPSAAKKIPIPPISPPTFKPRSFTRFRSLSVLRPRHRSKSVCPDSPVKIKAKAAAAVVMRKKANYVTRPPPLVNELALMQFADGGSMDSNIKRAMADQAKVAGTAGLADIYRDGEGGIWWDQEEEWEYARLLAEGDRSRPHATGGLQWATFSGSTSPSASDVFGEERRGSTSTQDSDLDPQYIVRPADILDGDDLLLFGPPVTPKPISTLPFSSRPRRADKHLRKPDFLVDVAFSRINSSPRSPKSQSLLGLEAGSLNPKGKARRRPAPLKLSTPSPACKRPTNSPIDPDKVRNDFIEASFAPVASMPVTPVTPAKTVCVTATENVRVPFATYNRVISVPWQTSNDRSSRLGLKKKPSVLNMMELFRSARKEDAVMC